MDREYGAVQLMLLYQLPRFSAQGGRPPPHQEDVLRRVLMRIVAWGVSHANIQKLWSAHDLLRMLVADEPSTPGVS
jgi:hypothetical protein